MITRRNAIKNVFGLMACAVISPKIMIKDIASNELPSLKMGGIVPGKLNCEKIPAFLEPGEFLIPKTMAEETEIKHKQFLSTFPYDNGCESFII